MRCCAEAALTNRRATPILCASLRAHCFISIDRSLSQFFLEIAAEIPELPLFKMVERKRLVHFMKAFVSGETAAIPGKLVNRKLLEAPPDMAAPLVLGEVLGPRKSAELR